MPTFETANGVVDTATMPPASINALLARGLSHVYGNETASRVVAAIRKNINAEKPSDVSTDAIKVWREANADAVAELTRKAHEDFTKALAEGTIGVRATGTGAVVDPLQREMTKRASGEIVEILKRQGAIGAKERKVPGRDEEFNLGGTVITFGDLVSRRLAHPQHGERIKRDATEFLRAQERAKKRSEEAVGAASGATSLEEMGL